MFIAEASTSIKPSSVANLLDNILGVPEGTSPCLNNVNRADDNRIYPFITKGGQNKDSSLSQKQIGTPSLTTTEA